MGMRRFRVSFEGCGAPSSVWMGAAEDWSIIADELRDRLRRVVERGNCASVVVTVHQPEEGCDHE